MGTFRGALGALSPVALLRLYLAVVVCAAALAIGAVLLTTSEVNSKSRENSSITNTAAAVSQVQAGLREPLTFLLLNASGFLISPDNIDNLSVAERSRVLEVISSGFAGVAPSAGSLPAVSVPMSDGDAVALHRAVDLNASQIDELVTGAENVNLLGVLQGRDRVRVSAEAYFEDDSASNFAALFSDVLFLGDELDMVGDQLSVSVASAQAGLDQASSRARTVMILSLASLIAMIMAATYLVGRLITRAFRVSETESSTLRQASDTLRYRNNQLNALYAVFSEITDTLSMKYVISATLRETLRVMNGASAVLRLVQGAELVAVGSLTAEGKEVPNLSSLGLGDGPSGRVARRGRSYRIDQAALDHLGLSPSPDHPSFGVESGVIAPLIVGARVVGTLAVWSREQNAFSDEDEHVLEMMASQVATAVAAADSAENHERRALHDPLTGLPNRRQLSEDIANRRDSLDGDGSAAVAMIDVDKFKNVNDEYGHRVGDVSLQKIASVLRTAMRDGDMIYRYGGEEFVAIFKGASAQDALVAAERLRLAVETAPITGEHLETISPITISIGVALRPDHGRDISQLIEKADRAMYRAKDLGRNRVEVWEGEALQRDITNVA